MWSKTAVDRDAWLNDIQSTMDALKDKVDAETGNIAPVWTPDGDCLHCEYCNSQFTMLLRRHHCRNCGAICCDTCSKKRFLVAHIHPTKEQRVCDECYQDLTTGNSRASGVGINDLNLVSSEMDIGSPGSQPKSNLPKRGRQSVILRGLEMEAVTGKLSGAGDGNTDSPNSGLSKQSSKALSRQTSSVNSPNGVKATPSQVAPDGTFILSRWISARDHEVHLASGMVVVENPLVKLKLLKPIIKRGMYMCVYVYVCMIICVYILRNDTTTITKLSTPVLFTP